MVNLKKIFSKTGKKNKAENFTQSEKDVFFFEK
jgi:hypothetical protein